MPSGSQARPAVAHSPCEVCGVLVDPLRAPFVAHIDAAFRFYCSRECHARRLEPSTPGPRSPASADAAGDLAGSTAVRSQLVRPSIEEVADMLGLTRASLPPEIRSGAARVAGTRRDIPLPPVHSNRAVPVLEDRASALVALGCIVWAALWMQPAAVPDVVRMGLIAPSAFVAIGLAGREVWRLRHEGGGMLAWSTALFGSLLALLLALRGDASASAASRLAESATLAAIIPVLAWAARWRLSQAQAALFSLASELPRTARVVRIGGGIETLESSRVRAGEEVLVESGEVVPVDGVVQNGGGIAVPHVGGGEPKPYAEGDSILASARVVHGPIRVLAARAGDDVSLARLPRIVGDPAYAPRAIRIADRVARILPLAAGAIGTAGAVVHAWGGGTGALSVLGIAVAAAPCALGAVLSRVPFMNVIARAARRGIVFRDAASVEAAATVGAVVLCTRGTVTAGRLELVDVVSLGSRSERELIAIAAAAESVNRDHPIARAVLEVASRRAVPVESVRRPAWVPGRGITAVSTAGESLAIGSRELLLAEGVSVAPAEDVARAIEGQRRTALFIAIAGRVEGVFGLEDPLRDEARPAVQAMMDAGFDLALLAGEARGTAEAIGLALDVANVRPEVLPEERHAAVRSIAEVANAVAVVGRPSRDDAALGAADVAISLSAAGAAGGETAVALASDDLRDAAATLSMARGAREQSARVLIASSVSALASATLCALLPVIGAYGALGLAALTAAITVTVARPTE